MSDKNDSQIALLNQNFEDNAPLMPQALNR
uniref:Defective integrase n=1 Tax=Providencia stuartii TaxID=588 RepID=A0AAI9D898_PROST|nr:defective integrase [Providencia stuartii]